MPRARSSSPQSATRAKSPSDAPGIADIEKVISAYAMEVRRLATWRSTIEPTFYPVIRSLLVAILKAQRLPFQVRASTSESRGTAAGSDMPDIAMYDGAGDFAVVLVEVKPPGVEIAEMAVSTDRNDQIGRYLQQTRAVLLSNARGFGW